ncbi:MAG: TraI domain-containing protein [Planctomycetes bacterium]|nr:TraI domain-containing protein [Planctomycetota bacterium]
MSDSRAAVRKLLAGEDCSALVRDVLERFPEFEPAQAQVLVKDIVERFFYEVMDLGASESYHHSDSWGLARHSLEVAVYALRVARSRHFVGHAAPTPEEQEHRLPRLRYACFLFALYHDAGKVLQAHVVGPGRDLHNPLVEALGDFYDRHGREQCATEWREGRGLEDHVEATPYVIGYLLPPASAGYLGPRIIAEVVEGRTAGARELREIIVEADQHSVCHARRKAEILTATYASGSFVAYLAKSFAEGTKRGKFAVNVLGGDVFLGRRFALFRYPEAVLKLVALAKEFFGRYDATVARLGEDDSGARFFLAKLKAGEGLFTDPHTGLWKLKSTVRSDGQTDHRECVLIPLEHLGLSAETAAFPGSVAFSRLGDGSEVVISDFQGLPAKPVEVVVKSPTAAAPVFPEPKVIPSTLGPQEGIDPEDLVRNLRDGMTAGWIPTNVPQAQVYVGPKTSFVATPAVFLKMRERGLYPEYDPQDRSSAYLRALARLSYVRKAPTNRIVYPIMLGQGSERALKVIKFDTEALLSSPELRARVGLWRDCERIVELPQDWKPGDAVASGGESDD